jgi:hypothetical protein
LYQAKGFDPEGLELARYFDHSVYQLSSEANVPFAHGISTIPLKLFLTDSNFIPVDDEDYYLDKGNQDPFGIDGSDDSSATENDGWYTEIQVSITLMTVFFRGVNCYRPRSCSASLW